MQGQFDEALALAEASVARARSVSDEHRLVFALTTLGNVHLAPEAAERSLARTEYDEALALCIALGGGWYERSLLFNLGQVDFEERRLDDAEQRFELSRSLALAAGDRQCVTTNTIGLAWVAAERGRIAEARAAAAVGVASAHELGMRNDVLSCLHLAAYLEALDGDAERGALLLGAYLGSEVETGIAVEQLDKFSVTETRMALRRRLENGAIEAAMGEGAALSLEAAFELAVESLG
jgi:hypothetical protein